MSWQPPPIGHQVIGVDAPVGSMLISDQVIRGVVMRALLIVAKSPKVEKPLHFGYSRHEAHNGFWQHANGHMWNVTDVCRIEPAYEFTSSDPNMSGHGSLVSDAAGQQYLRVSGVSVRDKGWIRLHDCELVDDLDPVMLIASKWKLAFQSTQAYVRTARPVLFEWNAGA